MKKWLILPLLLSLSLTACTSGMELKKHTFTFELGADVFANPSLYVKNPDKYDLRNAKVISNSKGLSKVENLFVNEQKDYLACGVYEFTLVDGRTKIPFKVKVKDTQAPNVRYNPTEIKVGKGEVPDFQDAFQATDLSGANYDATWDTTTSGTSNVTVRIYDRFGNSVSKEVQLVVE